MSTPVTTQESIRSVRRRLWLLLLRAFGVVVLMIVGFALVIAFLWLGTSNNLNPFYRAPVAYLLESYYQGHGDWQGVERLFAGQEGEKIPFIRGEWLRVALIDDQGIVVAQQGQIDGQGVGRLYQVSAGELILPLTVNGRQVGSLVYPGGLMSTPWRLAFELIPPMGMILALLGLLTLVIGLLLMRRVVEPLAEVIAAAQAVAAGDLGSRVPLHRHRDDLYALSASFNRMAEALERQDRQRKMLLADIAHELRTPLTILRGRLEGVVDGVYPADTEHIAPALEETYLLERLVEDLRLLSLAEARQLPLELRRMDLSELAAKVVNTFSAEAAELGIQLDFQPGAGIGAGDFDVQADPQRLEQVTGNLIGNALRYIPQGGTVQVQVRRVGEQVELSVQDDGPGVAEADLAFIFERFWRGERSRARASGGAGLGLAIAKQLVEAMGGEIGARNRAEGGLEVWFRLPPL